MAQKFKNQIDAQEGIKITNELYDGSNAAGTSGQVLSSTGTGTQWVDFSANTAERIEVTVKNTESVALTKGTVVHAHPTASPPSGNLVEIKKADYDTASLMPAIGILKEDILAAGAANNGDEGQAVMFGSLSGISTTDDGTSSGTLFSIGDELYVGNDGLLTNTKPTSTTQLIQKIAVVIKSHATNGLIKIFGAGRSNDVPNEIDRNVNFTDNSKLTFGDSTTPDLEIYHNGSNSFIENSTGYLMMRSDTAIYLRSATGNEQYITCNQNGSIDLYYDDSKKFETTSAGVSVTGSITTNLSSEGTYFTGGSGSIRQLSITSGTNVSAHALHTFNIASSNGKYEFDINGITQLSLDSSNATFAGDVTITGDLIVSGSETILNTETVQVEDNIIQLNRTPASPNDTATAATSGITIYRGNGVTEASFIFDDADDTWDLTHNLAVAVNGKFGTVGATNNSSVKTFDGSIVTKVQSQTAGDTAGVLGTESNHVLKLVTNNITALTIDTSQDTTFESKIGVKGSLSAITLGGAITAYSETVSTNLFSALRVIDNTSGSSYWDIGATGNASTLLNFYHNANTTPKISFTHLGGATFNGDITLPTTGAKIILDAYTTSSQEGGGIFFRQGFSSSNIYNLSIIARSRGNDGSTDGLSINAYEGIAFSTGSNSYNERLYIDVNGIATFFGDYISINDNGYIRGDDSGYLHFQNGSNGTRFYNYGNSVEILRIDNSYDLGIGYNQAITNKVQKTFATNHASGNRGAELHFGIYDGSFGGIQVKNIASSSSAYNSQFIEFHTHEGGVVANMAMRILPKGEVQIIDENGGNSKLQVRNFATTTTGSFTDSYMVEFRSAYTTGATSGALLVHTQEANDSRPTMAVSDSTGVFATFVNQKVAIGGTHTPSYALDVNSGDANVVARFESTDGTAAIMLKDSAGNVELSNSGSSFQVQPSGSTATFIAESNGRIRGTDGTRGIFLGGWDGSNNRIEGYANYPIFMTTYYADMNFGITGSTKMTLKSNGQLNLTTKPNSGLAYDVLINVGTSPDGVVGYQTVDQLAANIGASSSSNWVKSGNDIYNSNSGNVGIGISSGIAAKLHIVGNLRLYKDGSDINANTGVYIANAANNRAYNFQLNSDGSSLNLWAYGGSSWGKQITFHSSDGILIQDDFHITSGSSYQGFGWNRNVNDGTILNSSMNAFQMFNDGNLKLQGYNSSGTNQFEHIFYNSGNILFTGAVTLNKSDGTYIDLRHNNSTRGYLGIANQVITGGSTSDLGITATSNLVFGSGGTTRRMTLDSAGNFGVHCIPEEKFMVRTGTAYTGHTGSAIKITNQGYRDSELTSFTEGGYFTHYFENYTGGNGRYYDRVLEIVCKGSPDGTYGESVIKFMANPITSGSNVSEIMRITGSKWVGINTKTKAVYGGAGMDVTGASQTGIRVSSSTSGGGALEIGADSVSGYIQNVVAGDKTYIYTSASSASDTLNTTFLGGNGVSIGGTGTNGTRLDLIGGGLNQMNISNATGNWGLLLGFGDGTATGNYHGNLHAAIINVQNQTLHLGANNTSYLKILGNGEITFTNNETIAMKSNRINSGYGTAANDADLWINYEGYLNSTSYYRDFRIGNGRGSQIAWADGSKSKFGINTTYIFSKLQQGQPTFDGYNGMYNDDRVGISNHGSLTGLMLASTYNDSTHPEYGLVFVQGPSTSSYNVWSLSPDGPAKGDSLNFIYQAQATNIHGTSPKFIMDGNGDFHADGDVVAYSSTASDERLKDNIITIDNALDKVKQLRGVSFVWNNGKRKDKKDIGVIAQEVEKVIPEIVYEKELSTFSHEKDVYKTVDYEKLTAVLIESVKELTAKVEALENKKCNCK